MRIFTDCVEMVREVERDLFEMGTRYQTVTVQDQQVGHDPEFLTIELFGYAYSLHDITESGLENMLEYQGHDLHWARVESEERCKGAQGRSFPLNPGEAWKLRADFWGQFLRNTVFSYTYGERWQEQISYVIRELQLRPYTRQAVITMYDRHQDMLNWGGYDRVPCSISYQFMMRDDQLHVIYNQRSCDFVQFFTYDVYFTTKLLWHIAEAVGVKAGTLTHFLGSLHAFAKNLKGKDIF